MELLDRLQTAITAFDKANSEDPNTEMVNGQAVSKELLYSQRMSERLSLFATNSSEELQLAARSQHIQRWKSLRSDYPDGRQGYKTWRSELAKFHAKIATELMAQAGYGDDSMGRVETLLLKKGIKRDTEVQTLEDVICLVFLEFYLEAFTQKHSEEKIISIIQKTWLKMSEQGHQAALQLPLNHQLLALVQKALS